jgi:hypothetical protein
MDSSDKISRVFVTGEPFLPSLTFASKAVELTYVECMKGTPI